MMETNRKQGTKPVHLSTFMLKSVQGDSIRKAETLSLSLQTFWSLRWFLFYVRKGKRQNKQGV